MGSDCSSFHQERSHTMRWGYLALILLVTVAGVQLLEEENAEFALNNLSEYEGKQSLADTILPLVKRETEKKRIQKKKSKKDRKKKRSRNVGQTKKNGNGGKKGSRKVGKKGGKGGRNKKGSRRKNNRRRNCKNGKCNKNG